MDQWRTPRVQPSEPPRCLTSKREPASVSARQTHGARRSAMSRRTLHLLVLCGAVTLAVLAPANAASAAGPTSVTINGPGLKQPLTVAATAQPDAFKRLLNEVSWLATQQGNA